ncbi:MAG: hypothetical protein ACLP01_11540 [Solirubrobacteraceae bacterium]
MSEFVCQAEPGARAIYRSGVQEAPTLIATQVGIGSEDVRDPEIHWEHNCTSGLDQSCEVVDGSRRHTPDAADRRCRIFGVRWCGILGRRKLERRIDVYVRE